MRYLITNADDFGWTRDVNEGIVHAHLHGVLTSTTLMATGAAFDHAVELARQTPTLDIGCHLVLVHGTSLVTGKRFPERPRDLALAVATGRIDPYRELRPQIEKILDARLRPTHLDSHKHTHALPWVFLAVARLAREFQIPFMRVPFAAPVYRRIAARHGVRTPDHFLGFRLTGRLDEDTFVAALSKLPDGVSEFMCHPGFLGPELSASPTRLKDSRVRELEALTSPRVRALLSELQVRLGPFSAAPLP